MNKKTKPGESGLPPKSPGMMKKKGKKKGKKGY